MPFDDTENSHLSTAGEAAILAEAVISSVCHALGGPLNVIHGRAQMAVAAKSPEAQARQLQLLKEQVDKLNTLVGGIRSRGTALALDAPGARGRLHACALASGVRLRDTPGAAPSDTEALAPAGLAAVLRWAAIAAEAPDLAVTTVSPQRPAGLQHDGDFLAIHVPRGTMGMEPWLPRDDTPSEPLEPGAVVIALLRRLARQGGGWVDAGQDATVVYWPCATVCSSSRS